jgi:integrase/recombinase XerD
MSKLAAPTTETLTVAQVADAWRTSLRASDRSPKTLAIYEWALGKFLFHVGPDRDVATITPDDIEAMHAALKASGLSDSSRSGVDRPLRTFFAWAVKRGRIAASPMDGVEKPKVKVQPVEFVSDDEWAAILRTTVERSRHAYRARRDRAILLILSTTGARLNEVATLRVQDVDLVTETITVMGKGGKVRVLPLLPEARDALKVYLTRERPRSDYRTLPNLWLGPRGPMTGSGIAQMLGDRAKAAGITRSVHPHELRHRFVADALKGGLPDSLVMALTGHSTPAMLARYGAYTRQQDAMKAYRTYKAAS